MDCEITRVIIRMVSMVYFRSLLSKRYPEIFLFEIVVPLTTDAQIYFVVLTSVQGCVLLLFEVMLTSG